MGRTTYEWVLAHLEKTGEKWPYTQPCWVFTHADLEPIADNVRIVAGKPDEHHEAIAAAAGDKDIWVVGGGDLAAQLADAGLLDEVILYIAPVTLGAGRPLFPRPLRPAPGGAAPRTRRSPARGTRSWVREPRVALVLAGHGPSRSRPRPHRRGHRCLLRHRRRDRP